MDMAISLHFLLRVNSLAQVFDLVQIRFTGPLELRLSWQGVREFDLRG